MPRNIRQTKYSAHEEDSPIGTLPKRTNGDEQNPKKFVPRTNFHKDEASRKAFCNAGQSNQTSKKSALQFVPVLGLENGHFALVLQKRGVNEEKWSENSSSSFSFVMASFFNLQFEIYPILVIN